MFCGIAEEQRKKQRLMILENQESNGNLLECPTIFTENGVSTFPSCSICCCDGIGILMGLLES